MFEVFRCPISLSTSLTQLPTSSLNLFTVLDPAQSIVSPFTAPFANALPGSMPVNPLGPMPQDSYTAEQQADINSLLKGLKGYGGAQSGWFMPGGQLPTVSSAMQPLAGPIDSLPSGSGARAQAQAQLQQALSVLGYSNNPNALGGYLSQMGMVGQGQSPEQMAQGLLGQIQGLGNSQPFNSIQSQLGLNGGLNSLTSQQQNLLNSLGISQQAQSQLMALGLGNLGSQATGQLSSLGVNSPMNFNSLNSGNTGMNPLMNAMGMSGGSNPMSSSINPSQMTGSSFSPTAQQLQGLSQSQLASLGYASMRFNQHQLKSNSTMANSTMSSNAIMTNGTMSVDVSSNSTMPTNSTMPSSSTVSSNSTMMNMSDLASMPGPGESGNAKPAARSFPSSLSPEQLTQLQGLLQAQMGNFPNLGSYNPALGEVQQSLSPAQAQAVLGALSSLTQNANGLNGLNGVTGGLSLSQLQALQGQLQNGALAGTPAAGILSSLFGTLPLKLSAQGQTTPNFPASAEMKAAESGSMKMESSQPTSSMSMSKSWDPKETGSSTWSYSEWTTVMPSSMSSSSSSSDGRWSTPTASSGASPSPTAKAEEVALGDGNKYAWSWSSSGMESSSSMSSASPSPTASEAALGSGNRYAWSWSSEDAKDSSSMSKWYRRKRSDETKDAETSLMSSEEPATVTVTTTVTPTSTATPSITKSKMHHSKSKTSSPSSTGSSKDKEGENGVDVEVDMSGDETSSKKKHHRSDSPEATSTGGAKKLAASPSASSSNSTSSPCPSHSMAHGPTLVSGPMALPSGMVPYPA